MTSLKEDIEEFMKEPYEDVVKAVVNSKDSADFRKKLWEGMFPKGPTKNNIWDYYRSNQYSVYLFWLAMQKQDEPVMPQILANVIDTNITQPRILDFGCGDGMIAIGLKNMGFNNITLADVPHLYNRFLKHISDKYGWGVRFVPIEVWNEYPLDRKYDFIICDGVLEHVWEPEVTLLHLTEHLEYLGYLYVSDLFTDMKSDDPSHLKRNNIYKDAEEWCEVVEGTGLKRKFQDESGVWKIFQKA